MLRPLRGTLSPLGRATAVASSWWLSGGVSAANCVAAYAPKGAASLAASYTNLANPGTYDAAPGVAPAFNTTTGWTFSGSQYLKTGIVPANGQSWIVCFANRTGTNDQWVFGLVERISGTLYNMGARPCDGFNSYTYYYTDKQGFQAGAVIDSGVVAITPVGAYKNGTLDKSWSSPASPTFSKEMIIGGRHYYEPGLEAWSASLKGDVVALACYSIDISSYISALTSAMNAL